MKTLLNFLALAVVVTVTASNLYWQWANAWVACGIALAASFAVCLTVEKVAIRRAHAKMRKEFGVNWNV